MGQKGYRRGKRDGKTVLVHRVIWEEAHGPIPDGWHIHHINGDIHDNRLDNLLAVSPADHIRLHHETWVSCRICHDTARPHFALGLCQRCYFRERSGRTPFAWSRKHERCLGCGTTERRHYGHGRCENCYRYGDGQKPGPQRVKGRDVRWSRKYAACVNCGTTASQHHSLGLCNACYCRKRREEKATNNPT